MPKITIKIKKINAKERKKERKYINNKICLINKIHESTTTSASCLKANTIIALIVMSDIYSDAIGFNQLCIFAIWRLEVWKHTKIQQTFNNNNYANYPPFFCPYQYCRIFMMETETCIYEMQMISGTGESKSDSLIIYEDLSCDTQFNQISENWSHKTNSFLFSFLCFIFGFHY